MNRVSLALIFLASFLPSHACINEYRTSLTGHVYESHEFGGGKVWNVQRDTAKLRGEADELLAAYLQTGDLESYSDYAALLTYLGAYDSAKKVYEKIERESPDLYTTASNLGTIYELLGKPDSALFWIKKSVAINPESHEGSEWIHLKILQFKLSQQSAPSGSILHLDFGESVLPINPEAYDLAELAQHLRYQLKERISFVPPPNLIVGSLYFDLGNVLAQTQDVETALVSYREAQKYGFTSALMSQRIEAFEELALKAVEKQNKRDALFTAVTWVLPISLLISFGVGLIWGIKKLRRGKL